MLRSLFFTTALAGLAGTAMAQGAYVNGVYTPAGSSITVPNDGSVMLGGRPTLGAAYQTTGGTYHGGGIEATVGGQYQTVQPSSHTGHQSLAVPPGSSQTYTIPAGQDATYNVVVPSAAPAITYAQPAATPNKAAGAGWKARSVYVGARAGITSTSAIDFAVAGENGHPPAYIQTEQDEPGYTGSVVIGYRARAPQGWGYRVEVEGGYQTASVESHLIRGTGKFSGGDAFGDTKVLYGFVNAYGDIPVTDRIGLTAGGGVGIGHVEFDGYGVRGAGTALDDTATAFGYHVDAGVTYQLTDKVALEALYRYQSFVNAEVQTENGNKEEIDLDNHSILAGVRVGF